jgi:hypothetical protein
MDGSVEIIRRYDCGFRASFPRRRSIMSGACSMASEIGAGIAPDRTPMPALPKYGVASPLWNNRATRTLSNSARFRRIVALRGGVVFSQMMRLSPPSFGSDTVYDGVSCAGNAWHYRTRPYAIASIMLFLLAIGLATIIALNLRWSSDSAGIHGYSEEAR